MAGSILEGMRSGRWLLFLLGAGALALVVSGLRPYGRVTWLLEVFPIFIGVPILLATRRRFPLVGAHGAASARPDSRPAAGARPVLSGTFLDHLPSNET
jgi:hypothetical protein